MATAAVVTAVVGSTAYSAKKMGDAADAQKKAAQNAQNMASEEAAAIEAQTAALREQLASQQAAMEAAALQSQNMLNEQRGQYEQLVNGMTQTFEQQLEQTRNDTTTLLAGQQSQMEQAMLAEQDRFGKLMGQQSAHHNQQMAQQREAAAANAQLAEEAKNRANQKKPATEAFIANNERKGLQGQSGTLLTGPGGIASGQLPLGRNTLLGG